MNTVALDSFSGMFLPGRFLLIEITEISASMIDPAGRPALAKTIIIGTKLYIFLAVGMEPHEQSISIYHELLEGLTVAMDRPPQSVEDFLESDFEAAAVAAHEKFGFATPENVLIFLQGFGFQ